MADPTRIIDRTANVYATKMGEDWDSLSQERKLQWRALAFLVYEVHVKNRLDAMEQCIEVAEMVQTAPSTPKGWLRGAQETKNALVAFHLNALDELDTRPEIPEAFPEDLGKEDPYKDLRAGDLDPEKATEGLQCGAMHEDNWTCTRKKHPDHWNHWDSDLGDYYEEEDVEYLEGQILATWYDGQRLDSLHHALGEIDDE